MTRYGIAPATRVIACCLLVTTVVATVVHTTIAAASNAAPAMLPPGYLNARGSQIVDGSGNPVRIACMGGFGTVFVHGRLGYSQGIYSGVDANIAAVAGFGFNCIRVDFTDKSLDEPVLMKQFDQLVAACKRHDVRVIFDNHNNEATMKNIGNAAQQSNGLWFDTGPGTDGTDGGGDKGTVSSEQFQKDWVRMAKHWAGNPTVIGFDIRNEPCARSATQGMWGNGGPTDIRAMYQDVGNAILRVNPGALIICEGVINYGTGAYEGDLSAARNLPVVLGNPAKLVYSVHEYPKEIGGYPGPESGPGYVDRMNKTWGYLISRNIAPVWVGEMGSSMDSLGDFAWARTLLSYMNGSAPDGVKFTGSEQPISGDWWRWGYLPGEAPIGCIDASGKLRPPQARFMDQLLYRPRPIN